MKILIVGAGMGGLTAARALMREGFEVQVVEQAARLREVGAGLGLLKEALAILDTLGVGESVRASAMEVKRGFVGSPQGWRLTGPLPRLRRPALFLHRAHLQRLLLAGIEVRLGFRCHEVGQDAQGVWIRSASGEELRGDLLVGADGVHSLLRTLLWGEVPLRQAGPSWRAVIPWADWPDHLAGEIWGWGVRWGAARMQGGMLCWWATTPAERNGGLERLRRWPWQVPARMLDATPPEIIYATPLEDLRLPGDWGRGRITLLGDAAHATTPNLGAGAGMAIQDAQTLARWLVKEPGPAGLRAYERERRRPTSHIVKASAAVGWMAHHNPLGFVCS